MIFRLLQVENKKRHIFVVCKDETGQRRTLVIDDFFPYFFCHEYEQIPNSGKIQCIEGGYRSLMGEPLNKVVVEQPHQVKNLRKKFECTWESDVIFTRRFIADVGIRDFFRIDDSNLNASGAYTKVSYKDIEPYDEMNPTDWDIDERVMYLDIETNGKVSPDNPEREIVTISYLLDGEYTSYILGDGKDVRKEWDRTGKPWNIKYVGKSLPELTYRFSENLSTKSPDLIVGYNILGFDNPVIANTMRKLNISTKRLSPLGLPVGYDNRVKGLVNVDMQIVWSRISANKQRYDSLEHVAGMVGWDIRKHKRSEIPEMYSQGRLEEIADYNLDDVEALPRIDKEFGMISFLLDAMREGGIRESDITKTTPIHDNNMLLLRGDDEILPRK